MPRKLLMGSGPSSVPDRVLEALAEPTIGHLDPDFLAIADRTNERLRSVFQTANPATFPVSGTGSAGMETMLVNCLEPGDRLVVAVCGLFGERICDAASRLGVEVVRIEAEWGTAVDPERLADALAGGADALAVVHGETSTGVAQPLDGLADAAREHDALLLIDCVTSLGGYPLSIDEVGADVAFSGTQKCLNCPPGLAPLTIGERARARLERRRGPVPSWCFDLRAILAYWSPGSSGERIYHHTPPVNSIYALGEALELVLEEGLDARWQRHRAASTALLAGLEPLGFEPLVAESRRLWPLTTVRVPDGLDEAAVRAELLAGHRVEISGGFGPLKGRIWRIGTMGVNASAEAVSTLTGAIATTVREEAAGDVADRVAAAWTDAIEAPAAAR